MRRAAAVLLALALVPMLTTSATERLVLDAETVLAEGRLALPDGTVLVLTGPVDVRADGFRVVVQDGDEEAVLDVAPHLHAGVVEGVPGSWAVLSLTRDGVLAAWAEPAGPLNVLAPLAYVRGGVSRGDHVLLPPAAPELIDDGGVLPPQTAQASLAPPAGDRPARILVDVDEAFWRFHSCVVPAVSPQCPAEAERWAVVAEHAIAVVDVLFHRQPGVRLEVSELHVWRSMSPPYPYTTGLFIDVYQHLYLARDHWESVRPTFSDERDLLHLLSGRNPSTGYIGYAFIGAVGSPYGYAVSSTSGWAPRHYVLVAHEIGHNFDGVHEQAGPPASLGPAYQAGATYQPGTIMTSTICGCYEFSDGTGYASKDNTRRIREHAGWAIQGP